AVAETGSTANSYQVLAKLATGGMAEIYLARGASVGGVERYVVMKRVLREHASDIHFLKMFLDEARLAAQLQHPNIAQVYDVGKLGDSYFFTMEYVHGDTVRGILQRAHELRRSPPLSCVLAIVAGAAAGLHHAHERIGVDGRPLGIVHRDVSPTNLMVGFDGSVKVVDFGVAKVADRVNETKSGAVKGKIGYLSPEQARGMRLDRRSDLYALGIVMWEMLTVERLYKRDSDFEAMSAIITEPTPPPSSRRRDVPPELDRLVLRALAKSPDDRFQTAEELGEAIEAVAVQTSSPLSAASLSRFLRELFGPRPEPWKAVADRARGEVVTVTSEPVPRELRVPTHDPVDRRLADVPDLSADAVPEPTSAVFVAADAVLAPRRRWPGLVAAGGAAIVVAIIVMATSGGSDPPAPDRPSDPATLANETTQGVITYGIGRANGTASSDTANATTGSARTTGTAATSTGNSLTTGSDPTTNNAPTVGSARTSGNATASGSGSDRMSGSVTTYDGSIPATDRSSAPRRRDRDPNATTTEPRPPSVDPTKKLVTECAASTSMVAREPVKCTLAACQLHDVDHAKRWLAKVAVGSRAGVVDACGVAGTHVEAPPRPPPSKPAIDCTADPMACPR
ncbi:MAG TPA: protein kinase, partial [Kofleriaceae bacterium]|nr:protein kinase [Kofleriaceae bacterium]